MPTASYLIADMQVKLGDPSGNIFTSATLLNWLDEAQKEFIQRATPLRLVDATSVRTGQYIFGIPDDNLIIEAVVSRNRIPTILRHVTAAEYHDQVAACPGAVTTDPYVWTEIDQKIYVHPAYGNSSASGTVLTPITATQTTLNFTNPGSFPLWGRVGITDSDDGGEVEECEYGLLDKNTGVAINCARGLAHTEAASGGVAYPLNHLPFWIIYRTAPESLGTVTATPEIHSVFHEKLEDYVMYLAHTQEGNKDKAKMAWDRWNEAVSWGQYFSGREHLSQIGLSDFETTRMKSLYGA